MIAIVSEAESKRELELVLSCMKLVWKQALDFRRVAQVSGVDLDDLHAQGQLGLVLAARTFDAGLGKPFVNWAYRRIRWAMCRLLKTSRPLRSMPLNEEGDSLALELPAPEEPGPFAGEEVRLLLGALTKRHRRVIELAFGLEDGISRSQSEIALLLGVSGARIGQVQVRALAKLRREAERRGVQA